MQNVGQKFHSMINGTRRGVVHLPIFMTGQIDPLCGAKLNKEGRLGEEEFKAYGGNSPGQWCDEGLVLGLYPNKERIPEHNSCGVIQQIVSRWGSRQSFTPVVIPYNPKTRTFNM